MSENCKHKHCRKHKCTENNIRAEIKIYEQHTHQRSGSQPSLPPLTITTGALGASTSFTASFISLFNNLGSGFSSVPGPILFQDANANAGILQATGDITLSPDNATINVSVTGIYFLNYDVTIELNAPASSNNWFTSISVNHNDIIGPNYKSPAIVGLTRILPFSGSLIVNLFASSIVQLQVAAVDGTRSWRIAPNSLGFGTVTMTIFRIM
jgi:hypothetical protein